MVGVDLLKIPGVGPSIAADLNRLGVRETAELRGRNPEAMYRELCRMEGKPVDRCVLYVFRCAVYFASEPVHDPELLQWWRWKDEGGVSGRPEAENVRRRRSAGRASRGARRGRRTEKVRRGRAGVARPL